MTAGDEVLDVRALNRALLARQLLLERADGVTVLDAVRHLVGLQAQAPTPPYYALWSRLPDFDPDEVGRLLESRELVRIAVLRGTVHLVAAEDAALLRPLVQVVIERQHRSAYGRRTGGAELQAIAAAVRAELAGGPRTARELGLRLVERGIGDDVEAMTNAARMAVPLVQLPPRGVWGRGGAPRCAALEDWIGRPLEVQPSVDAVVVRYLAAFGPASAADARAWCGLTRLAPVFERLRERLVAFRDESGRELFDLPDGPRPDPDVPAPPRLLGEFDNVLIGHADRARIIPPGRTWSGLAEGGRSAGNLLVDGVLAGTWRLERDGRRSATAVLRPFAPLPTEDRDAIAHEAEQLLAFAAADTPARTVRFEPPAAR